MRNDVGKSTAMAVGEDKSVAVDPWCSLTGGLEETAEPGTCDMRRVCFVKAGEGCGGD